MHQNKMREVTGLRGEEVIVMTMTIDTEIKPLFTPPCLPIFMLHYFLWLYQNQCTALVSFHLKEAQQQIIICQ